MHRYVLLTLTFGAAACGTSPSEPTVTWTSLAGVYQGSVTGSNQFEQLSGTLSLTLTQDAEHLSGSYQFTGVVSGGVIPGAVSAQGSVVGTITLRGLSEFTLTLYEPQCGLQGSTARGYQLSHSTSLVISDGTLLVCADPAAGIVIDRTYSFQADSLNRLPTS